MRLIGSLHVSAALILFMASLAGSFHPLFLNGRRYGRLALFDSPGERKTIFGAISIGVEDVEVVPEKALATVDSSTTTMEKTESAFRHESDDAAEVSFKSVTVSSEKLILTTRLDIRPSPSIDGSPVTQPIRNLEWTLSNPSSDPLEVLVSSNESVFMVRGRMRDERFNDQVFELSLLQCSFANISVDSRNRAIVIELKGYSSILESAVVVLSLGGDSATSQSMFMRSKLFFKEDLQRKVCLDSIQHIRAKIEYESLSSKDQEEYKFFFESTSTMEEVSGLDGPHKIRDRSFFANGWNAWSFCGAVLQGSLLPLYDMPDSFVKSFHDGGPALKFNRMRNKGSKDWIASDMFTVVADRRTRAGLVIGFLSQKQQFGCITSDEDYETFSVYTAHDGAQIDSKSRCIETDWLCVQVCPVLAVDPLANYMHLSGLMNGAQAKVNLPSCDYENTLLQLAELSSSVKPVSISEHPVLNPAIPVGWCSWYHFFDDITETCLNQNIEELRDLAVPGSQNESTTSMNTKEFRTINLFQVDDGYQTAWGDWANLKKREFPSASLRPLVDKIQATGLVPGIWMAPFACDKHSKIASKYPSWILRNRYNQPANSASCGKWFYGLDVTNIEVQGHIRNSIRHVIRDWGFRYLKLDFLYAGILSAKSGSLLNTSLTGAQAMQLGMTVIAQAVADVEGDQVIPILGCGAPIGSVIGHVHLNRISADAGLTWYPTLGPIPFPDKWNLPSASNMLRNSITRLSMHGRWWINDPDCIILRNVTEFTLNELHAIAVVKALSGGPLIISDSLSTVPEERIQIAKQLMPPSGLSAVALDLLDRETPELLRLEIPGTGGHYVLSSNCDCRNCGKEYSDKSPWVLFGICNWADFSVSHLIPASHLRLMPLGNPTRIKRKIDHPKRLHTIDFFKEEYRCIDINDADCHVDSNVLFDSISTHSASLLALREECSICPPKPLYLEKTSCSMKNRLEITFSKRYGASKRSSCNVYLYLPLQDSFRTTIDDKKDGKILPPPSLEVSGRAYCKVRSVSVLHSSDWYDRSSVVLSIPCNLSCTKRHNDFESMNVNECPVDLEVLW